MRKLFKERNPFKGGNYMRKYGKYFCDLVKFIIILILNRVE